MTIKNALNFYPTEKRNHELGLHIIDILQATIKGAGEILHELLKKKTFVININENRQN